MDDENTLDSDELMDEEGAEISSWKPRRMRVPRIVVWVSLGLFLTAVVMLGVWGLAHSTWTYGLTAVDQATTARLAQIETELRAAGAPQVALQYLSVAVRPGINVGDAIEALVEADKVLQLARDNPAIAPDHQRLCMILNELRHIRYGYAESPSTPLPPLNLPR